MRNLFLVLPLLFAQWTLLARADVPYSLTGVIASSGGGKAFAVIEQADGQQRLLSVGDSIGDGQVVSIDAEAKSVRLALPDGDILLTLTGSALPDDPRDRYSIEDYAGTVEKLRLNGDTAEALLDLSRNREKLGEEKSAERLNQLLGLSSGASIAGLNGQAVGSTGQLLEWLSGALAESAVKGSYLGSLSVEDDSGKRRVYLTTAQPSD